MPLDFEVYDLDALQNAQPQLVKVKVTPDTRKIRSALQMGFDIPGVRVIGDQSEVPAESAAQITGASVTGAVVDESSAVPDETYDRATVPPTAQPVDVQPQTQETVSYGAQPVAEPFNG